MPVYEVASMFEHSQSLKHENRLLRKERAALLSACKLAALTLEGLAARQAMRDDSYTVPLAQIKAAIALAQE